MTTFGGFGSTFYIITLIDLAKKLQHTSTFCSNDYKMIYKKVYFMIGHWRALCAVAICSACMLPLCSVYGGVSEQWGLCRVYPSHTHTYYVTGSSVSLTKLTKCSNALRSTLFLYGSRAAQTIGTSDGELEHALRHGMGHKRDQF